MVVHQFIILINVPFDGNPENIVIANYFLFELEISEKVFLTLRTWCIFINIRLLFFKQNTANKPLVSFSSKISQYCIFTFWRPWDSYSRFYSRVKVPRFKTVTQEAYWCSYIYLNVTDVIYLMILFLSIELKKILMSEFFFKFNNYFFSTSTPFIDNLDGVKLVKLSGLQGPIFETVLKQIQWKYICNTFFRTLSTGAWTANKFNGGILVTHLYYYYTSIIICCPLQFRLQPFFTWNILDAFNNVFYMKKKFTNIVLLFNAHTR